MDWSPDVLLTFRLHWAHTYHGTHIALLLLLLVATIWSLCRYAVLISVFSLMLESSTLVHNHIIYLSLLILAPREGEQALVWTICTQDRAWVFYSAVVIITTGEWVILQTEFKIPASLIFHMRRQWGRLGVKLKLHICDVHSWLHVHSPDS